MPSLATQSPTHNFDRLARFVKARLKTWFTRRLKGISRHCASVRGLSWVIIGSIILQRPKKLMYNGNSEKTTSSLDVNNGTRARGVPGEGRADYLVKGHLPDTADSSSSTDGHVWARQDQGIPRQRRLGAIRLSE